MSNAIKATKSNAGPDFYLHSSPWELDVAPMRLDASAAVACSDDCVLRWARGAFTAHLQVRMGEVRRCRILLLLLLHAQLHANLCTLVARC